MKTIAWILVILVGLRVLIGPLVIGENIAYGFGSWIGGIITGALIIVVCGRVLGWW